MAVPLAIIDRVSVPANDQLNIILGRKGTTLTGDSQIKVYLNREAVGITFTMFIGSQGVLENAGSAVNAAAGAVPSFQDDFVIPTFGGRGDLLVLTAINSTGGALEAGFILQITELDDVILNKALEDAALAGIQVG